MSFMSEGFELFFFETFSHDSQEGLNLDLVQFPHPIVIKEIRVIPLGSRVEADFSGGFRLGATNPSAFELEFFINDLLRSDACTFLDIGSLDYKQNVNIKFVPKEMIPTDGLILRGMYSTLTLSVFGCIANIDNMINQETIDSNNQTSDEIQNQPLFDDKSDESKAVKIESVCDDIPDESIDLKPIQIIQSLLEPSEESSKKKYSPNVLRTTESRASSLSSDKSERRRKDIKLEKESVSRSRSHHHSKDRPNRGRRSKSPLNAVMTRNRSRSRSRTNSNSRSATPNSVKRYHYNRRTPSSPPDRSPKRFHRSPRRRSPSNSPPFHPIKAISRSPISPSSRSLSQTNDISKCEDIKPEIKPIEVKIDDSLFEPLSPDRMSLSDIAEKISDDENFDQILNEIEDEDESGSKCDVFDEISSEEEYEDDGNADNELLMDYTEYELSVYADFTTFNPFQCEFIPLQTLNDSSISIYDTQIDDNLNISQNEKIHELVNKFQNQTRNEKWVEAIEHLSQEILKVVIKDESIINTLLEYVIDGLNFELALRQQMTAYKVRHLKAGIKLLVSLSQISDKILKRLLDSDLSLRLLELYNEDYMTIPVRLMIIRAIDVICDSASGVEHLITHTFKWDSEKSEPIEQTCYQKLIDLLVKNPSTRIIVALTALLKKIHLYEVLKYLSKINEENSTESSNEDSIAACLSEIASTFKNANNLINQPFRYLPLNNQFELKQSPYDSYKAIYKYFRHHNIIECITNIISGQLNCSSDAFDSVLDILNSISNFQHGLKFLLSHQMIDLTNILQKALIQQCDDPESQLQSIGLKLIYRLQVIQLVDILFTLKSKQEKSNVNKENFDDPEVIATLQHLYTMLFTGIGRDAIVHILSSEHNFDAILKFITLRSDKKKELVVQKSVSYGCTLELCLITLQLLDVNTISFLDNYGQTLLKICENNSTPKLQSISNWLSPIKNNSYNVYNENTFKHLISMIKKHCDLIRDQTENSLFNINPELITTLRIIQHLCIPSEYQTSDSEVQLKYKYAIINIFSNDGLSQILFLLNKLCDTYLKPSHQSVAMIGNQGSLVVSFVKPAVFIIKSILNYLVSARGSDFKDVSPIPTLLRIYSVMALIPQSMLNVSNAQQIQYEITEILLIYTELHISSTESEDSISKSVWTKMTKYIIDYTLSSPLTFLHGLNLFSDVLPQTLPLIVKQPMINDEITKTINFRKLWSAHLHPLNEDIETLISSLIFSNSQTIQLLLRRICAQLCDLSAPTVNLLVKCIVEIFAQNLESFNFQTNNSGNVVMSPTVRILIFILDLSSIIPFKLGLLSNIGSTFKKEDKFGSLFTRLYSSLSKLNATNFQEILNNVLNPSSDKDLLNKDTNKSNASELAKTDISTIDQQITISENISDYFLNRQVFVLINQIEDERLVPDLMNALNDDSDQFDLTDSQKIDLIELSTNYFGSEFDIRSNLEKLWHEPIEPDSKETDASEKIKSLPFIKAGPKEQIPMNKRIQAPRGRGRAFTRLNDPFRSRPPNTSRPPSMHVDDFVALERHDSGPKRAGNKEFIRPNRGMNQTLRPFNPTLRSFNHSTNTINYNNVHRSSPSNVRNVTERYMNRDLHALSSNRMNKSNDFQSLKWNRINTNRYEIKHNQYSKSFNR